MVNVKGKWLISFIWLHHAGTLEQPVPGLRPYPLNIPGGTEFSGPIGRLSLCRGQQIIDHSVTIEWGDNQTSTGDWTDAASNLISAHRYRGLGQYPVTVHAAAMCLYFDGQTPLDDVVAGTIANVYQPVNLAKFRLIPSTVTGGQNSAGIVSIGCPAPPWGAEITITRDNLDEAVMPNSVTVNPGDSAAQFEIRTAPRPGIVNIVVKIGTTTLKRRLTVQ